LSTAPQENTPAATRRQLATQVLALGTTQTVAWASSTYLPAILARPVATDLGVTPSVVFGAFSVSLVVMALAGPAAGRAIDLHGGRRVLAISNFTLAAGLALLACASNLPLLFAAWCVIGAGMALGLYDAAFATLVRLHGHGARGPITGITLIAGFASTVGWPLTTWLSAHYGWRACCFTWAAIHLLLALPLNLLCIPKNAASVATSSTKHAADETKSSDDAARKTFVLMAVFFATTAFTTSAMAAHLPGLLMATGVSAAVAVTAGALLGPAQVAARVMEFGIAQRLRVHPLTVARVATALHPVAILFITLLFGVPLGAFAFAVLHGAGNGMITIAKGTLPLAMFGPVGYGRRTGLLSVAARGMQALAPFAFGIVLEAAGAGAALALSGALALIALGSLLALRADSSKGSDQH
jgi:MFS family permease